MKHTALIIAILAVSTGAFAQTYSNANLNGSYLFQYVTPKTSNWSKTFTCPSNSTVTFTVSGSTTYAQVATGVVALDGGGAVTSFSLTLIGKINQTASNNTVKVTFNSSCQVVSSNSGEIVYEAAAALTGTGTYSVQADGAGTLTLTPTTGSALNAVFQLAGTNGGLSSTAIFSGTLVNGKNIGTGIAVHQ
jgi:hypothetical protein